MYTCTHSYTRSQWDMQPSLSMAVRESFLRVGESLAAAPVPGHYSPDVTFKKSQEEGSYTTRYAWLSLCDSSWSSCYPNLLNRLKLIFSFPLLHSPSSVAYLFPSLSPTSSFSPPPSPSFPSFASSSLHPLTHTCFCHPSPLSPFLLLPSLPTISYTSSFSQAERFTPLSSKTPCPEACTTS